MKSCHAMSDNHGRLLQIYFDQHIPPFERKTAAKEYQVGGQSCEGAM